MHLDDPTFPPVMSGHAVKAPLTAFAEACRCAQAGSLGAADVVWSRNTARADMALILEPEVGRGRALQMMPLAAVAIAETVGFLAPPQVAVEFLWPNSILLNGARAGEIKLALADGPADAPPAWLVIGVTLDLVQTSRDGEPGARPHQTVLAEEGAAEITRTDVISALAPRLLAWLHTWGEDGFRPIHDQWLFRAFGREQDIRVEGHEGRVLGLDEDANLLLRDKSGTVQSIAFPPYVVGLPATTAS